MIASSSAACRSTGARRAEVANGGAARAPASGPAEPTTGGPGGRRGRSLHPGGAGARGALPGGGGDHARGAGAPLHRGRPGRGGGSVLAPRDVDRAHTMLAGGGRG